MTYKLLPLLFLKAGNVLFNALNYFIYSYVSVIICPQIWLLILIRTKGSNLNNIVFTTTFGALAGTRNS